MLFSVFIIQKLQQKLNATSSWLSEQTDFLESLQIDQSFENVSSVEVCKRNLIMIGTQASKNQESANELLRMLGSLPMSPTNHNQHHLDDLDERFELLNFELEEKLKEMENVEEMLKLISKYETVR